MVDRRLASELAEYINENIVNSSKFVTTKEIMYYLVSKILENHMENIIEITVDLLEKKGIEVIHK